MHHGRPQNKEGIIRTEGGLGTFCPSLDRRVDCQEPNPFGHLGKRKRPSALRKKESVLYDVGNAKGKITFDSIWYT
jgi:hypothetical protein